MTYPPDKPVQHSTVGRQPVNGPPHRLFNQPSKELEIMDQAKVPDWSVV